MILLERFTGYFRSSEVRVFYFFNRRMHCTMLDRVMRSITHLGSAVFSIMLPLMLLASNNREAKALGLKVAMALSLTHLVVHLIKRAVNRPRPYKTLENTIAMKPPSCQYSFPSGHTCAAFTMAFVLANNMPEFGLAFYLLASMVGISRMYLGFHYPTDVLAGFLIAHLQMVLPLLY